MRRRTKSLPEKTADAIRAEHIDNGGMAPGDRLPTVAALAAQYDVSTVTVGHALGLLEQAGLIERRRGSGCYLRDPRPSRVRNSAPHVAFIAPNYSTGIFVSLFHGVESVCQREGYNVMAAGIGRDYETERDQVRRMVESGAHAIVLAPVSRHPDVFDTDYLRSAYPDVPIVLFGSAFEEQRRPSVVFDNYRVGRDFAEYLLDKGHRRIAMIDDSIPGRRMTHLATCQRHQGLVDALRQRGLDHQPCDHWHLSQSPRRRPADVEPHVRVFVDNWLAQPDAERATAVFGWNDAVAVSLIQALLCRGVSVPDDIEVIGFDNMPVARMFTPAFPTTQPDFERAGEIATELALAWAEQSDHSAVPRYILSVPLLFRQQDRAQTHGGSVIQASSSI